MFGTVVDYFPARGFGFVRQAERPADIFFHLSEFRGNPDALTEGAKVEFSLGERKGKVVARDVRLLEAGAE
jgi:cold shock CspA family protein